MTVIQITFVALVKPVPDKCISETVIQTYAGSLCAILILWTKWSQIGLNQQKWAQLTKVAQMGPIGPMSQVLWQSIGEAAR